MAVMALAQVAVGVSGTEAETETETKTETCESQSRSGNESGNRTGDRYSNEKESVHVCSSVNKCNTCAHRYHGLRKTIPALHRAALRKPIYQVLVVE